VLDTVLNFFSSVQTALTVTPFASMGAIALFARSLIISYVALYCLVGMVPPAAAHLTHHPLHASRHPWRSAPHAVTHGILHTPLHA
jgi:hypothetical protein